MAKKKEQAENNELVEVSTEVVVDEAKKPKARYSVLRKEQAKKLGVKYK